MRLLAVNIPYLVSGRRSVEQLTDPLLTDPLIVGIGASAGGVQALQRFFEALPADTGAAFVVIVHSALSP